MDEYYCPNCNAILNDQYGFDPDNGTWTCQVCGQTLYGDDMEETMSSFPGVIWYCDSCGAVLNKQSGFDDSCGSWYCTECGHRNPISEEEIYDSEQSYQDHISKSDNDDDDDDYGYGEEWQFDNPRRCECCGRLLNKQDGFEDWANSFICEKCGYLNEWSANDDEYDEDCEDNEEDTSSDNSHFNNSGGYSYTNKASYKTDELREFAKRASKQEKTRSRKKYWKVWIILIIISAAGLYIGYRVYEYKKLTVIGISSVACKDSSYTEIKQILQAAGFTNISTTAVEDLSFENLDQEGQIIAVTISGQTDFSADSKFPYDSRIIIEYHSAARIKPPIAPKDAKGSSCDDILKLFQDAGFGAVSLEADYDLLLGWINKDGSVESVSINGNTKYSIDSYYRVDAEIVIVYHAFRRDKDG